MRIDAIMTADAVTIDLDDSLRVVGEFFRRMEFHHLLVVEDGRLCGVVSDRDLLKASSPFLHTMTEQVRDTAILKKRVHQIMSRQLVTVACDTTVAEAVRLLLEKNVSCLPVLASDGTVEGIVTWRDLIRAYASSLDPVASDAP